MVEPITSDIHYLEYLANLVILREKYDKTDNKRIKQEILEKENFIRKEILEYKSVKNSLL